MNARAPQKCQYPYKTYLAAQNRSIQILEMFYRSSCRNRCSQKMASRFLDDSGNAYFVEPLRREWKSNMIQVMGRIAGTRPKASRIALK
jgi:hypothetical protein